MEQSFLGQQVVQLPSSGSPETGQVAGAVVSCCRCLVGEKSASVSIRRVEKVVVTAVVATAAGAETGKERIRRFTAVIIIVIIAVVQLFSTAVAAVVVHHSWEIHNTHATTAAAIFKDATAEPATNQIAAASRQILNIIAVVDIAVDGSLVVVVPDLDVDGALRHRRRR